MRGRMEEGGHKLRNVSDLYLETGNRRSIQLARKWGPPSYNRMEPNSANKEQATKWTQKGTQPANALVLVLQDPCQTSDLQNRKMANMCCLGCSVLSCYRSNRKLIHILWNTTQQWKRNALLLYTTWVDLKGIILMGNGQYQKVTSCTIPFIWHPQSGKVLEIENRRVIARG